MVPLRTLLTIIAAILIISPSANVLAQTTAKDHADQAAAVLSNAPKPLVLQFTKGQLKNYLLFGKPQDVQRYCNQNQINRNECIGTANILRQLYR